MNPIDAKPFTCKECGAAFAHEAHLSCHACIHMDRKPSNSHMLFGTAFNQNGMIFQTNIVQPTKKSVKCDECGLRFGLKGDLVKHTRNRPCATALSCPHCGISYLLQECLDKHIRVHHPPDNSMKSAIGEKREPQSHTRVCSPDMGSDSTTCSETAGFGEPKVSSDAAQKSSLYNNASYTSTAGSGDENESTKQLYIELPPSNLHNCEFCGATFGTRSMLQEHILVHASHEPHKCLHCGAVFTSKDQFKEHLRIHFPISAYSCQECCITFVNINKLNEHLRNCHPNGKIVGSGSGDAHSEASNNLRRQPIFPFPTKPHKCEECTASFASKRELWDHIHVHSDSEVTYTCQVCGIAFASLPTLTDHTHTHHPTKKEYDNSESDVRSLMQERQLCPPGVLMPYQCVHCGNEFLSESELVDHVRIHTSEMTYACQDCSLVFADATGLNKHIVSRHPGDKNQGGKVYNGNCRTGYTGNTDAQPDSHACRPFKCEICGSDFTRKTHLIRHALIHTGDKPHKCEQCGTAFGRKSHLQRHAFIHTGQKPHICAHCGMAFGRRSHLKRHSLRQHGEPLPSPSSLPSTSESSPMCTESTVRANHTVAFPGMQPHSVKSSASPPAQPAQAASNQVKQETEQSTFHSPSLFSPDPTQLPHSNPYWNLFQPMLSFNVNEALNWSRQNDVHSAHSNLKPQQKPVT